MDPEEISRLCTSLSIKGKEEKLWSIQHVNGSCEEKLDLCLVGKILSSKHINKEAFRVVILRIWQTIVDIDVFFGVGDIARLPFNKVVFWVQIINALLLCMAKEMGEFLGRLIRELVDIDVGVRGECFGMYMRLKVAIDVSMPLKRHSYLECHGKKERNRIDTNMEFDFGPWMRVMSLPGYNRSAGQHRYRGEGSNVRVGFMDNVNHRRMDQSWRKRNMGADNVTKDTTALSLSGSRELAAGAHQQQLRGCRCFLRFTATSLWVFKNKMVRGNGEILSQVVSSQDCEYKFMSKYVKVGSIKKEEVPVADSESAVEENEGKCNYLV
ncbi:hypothetical protein EZV62_004773 [Acer yangbiense]|uniref:DUF4283 domain-containing protein n=1 Tax=Acer yangbiense TaxID=1000413 RepID=A0A5C7IKV2_9ROSI|nr:hypothetical protein EZV62_004773 [Acer yangbiense]